MRLLVDKRNVDNEGKERLSKEISCKRGADPPKNLPGRTPILPSVAGSGEMSICVSCGNGSSINGTIFSNIDFDTLSST